MEAGDADRNLASVRSLLRRQQDLEVEALDTFGFRNSNSSEIPEEPVEQRFERRRHAVSIPMDGDRIADHGLGRDGAANYRTDITVLRAFELVIVLTPQPRIGEYVVGLVDLLESARRVFACHIGMEPLGKITVGRTNADGALVPRHAENHVVRSPLHLDRTSASP